MSLRAAILALALLALLGWVVSLSFYIVQQDQLALLLRFGKSVATITEPGLNIKIPLIDTVVVYDKHLLALEPPLDQIILGDQKRIEVTTFLRFRIDNPLQFFQSVGSEEQARINLTQIVSSTSRKQLGKIALPALLTEQRDEITNKIRDEVALEAKALGVVVTDVRILRAELPAETSQAIYDRMTSERVREAKELRAQGFEAAQEIRSKADRDRAVLLSDALRGSQTDRGAADAEANSIAVSAYGRDSEFFDLYRTLQVYRSALTQGAPVLVLTPSSELMKFFDAGPNERKTAPPIPSPQSPPSANGEKP
jgi:membrane protease subunit HflC